MAQLVERSLSTLEIRGSTPVIGKSDLLSTVSKDENNEKESRMGQFQNNWTADQNSSKICHTLKENIIGNPLGLMPIHDTLLMLTKTWLISSLKGQGWFRNRCSKSQFA